MLSREIEEFGRRIGLPGLHFSDAGLIELSFADLGTVTLEAISGEASPGNAACPDEAETLLLALALLPTMDALGRFVKALELTNWRTRLPYCVRAALVKDRLILTIPLDAAHAGASDIENALRFLIDFASRTA